MMLGTQLHGMQQSFRLFIDAKVCRNYQRSGLKAVKSRVTMLGLPIRPGGEIGRRAGLKIRFRKECRFDSDPGHQIQSRTFQKNVRL